MTKSGKIRNDGIRSRLNIFCINDRIKGNKTRWKVHVVELGYFTRYMGSLVIEHHEEFG